MTKPTQPAIEVRILEMLTEHFGDPCPGHAEQALVAGVAKLIAQARELQATKTLRTWTESHAAFQRAVERAQAKGH